MNQESVSSYEGMVYRAPSGQSSWKIFHDRLEIAGGAGYLSEDEAVDGCEEVLLSYDQAAAVAVEPRCVDCGRLCRQAEWRGANHVCEKCWDRRGAG